VPRPRLNLLPAPRPNPPTPNTRREVEGILGIWTRVVNAHVPLVASRSGHQLMLLDRHFPLPGAAKRARRASALAPRGGTGGGGASGGGGTGSEGGRLASRHSLSTGNLVDLGGASGGGGRPASPLAPAGGALGAVEAGSDSEAAPAPARRGAFRRSGGGSSGGGGGIFARRRAARAAAAAAAAGGANGASEAAALEGRLAPLLVVMAHPYAPFLAGLARFRVRIRVANIK
jgi:hypothetical protein